MSDIERQILDALARNTALLQRRSAVAARRAQDALDEYARQVALVNRTAGGGR